ncbi:hypothetical protein C8R45DRAFT_1136132 [Mycena sanguinolenta]|nr:hypothetical protein C8R45DRAFT_1136132 [Mycena sanguinolenta]
MKTARQGKDKLRTRGVGSPTSGGRMERERDDMQWGRTRSLQMRGLVRDRTNVQFRQGVGIVPPDFAHTERSQIYECIDPVGWRTWRRRGVSASRGGGVVKEANQLRRNGASISTGGLSVTVPGGPDLWWLAAQPNNLIWTCAQTTYTDFTVWINNSDTTLLEAITPLQAIEQNLNCHLLVSGELITMPVGTGYTIVLSDPSNVTNVEARVRALVVERRVRSVGGEREREREQEQEQEMGHDTGTDKDTACLRAAFLGSAAGYGGVVRSACSHRGRDRPPLALLACGVPSSLSSTARLILRASLTGRRKSCRLRFQRRIRDQGTLGGVPRVDRDADGYGDCDCVEGRHTLLPFPGREEVAGRGVVVVLWRGDDALALGTMLPYPQREGGIGAAMAKGTPSRAGSEADGERGEGLALRPLRNCCDVEQRGGGR